MRKLTTLCVALVAACVAAAPALADKAVGPFANAVHATVSLTLKDGSASTFTFDRGKVTAASSTSLTLQEGTATVSFTLDAKTSLRGRLVLGRQAAVFSQNGTALIVRAPGKAEDALHLKGPFAGAVHATIDATAKDGTASSLTFDRGEITAVDASSVTVKREDGQTVTLSLDSSTVVRDKGDTEDASALTVGERAMFFSQNGKVVLVRCISKAKASGEKASREKASGVKASGVKAGPFAGAVHGTLALTAKDGTTATYTFDRGQITKVDSGSVTLLRADGQSVTLTLDSSTVVRGKGKKQDSSSLQVGERAVVFSQDGKAVLIRTTGKA
jgi:hypothetical protein